MIVNYNRCRVIYINISIYLLLGKEVIKNGWLYLGGNVKLFDFFFFRSVRLWFLWIFKFKVLDNLCEIINGRFLRRFKLLICLWRICNRIV